ncbi:MAG: translocation/assembly module TamB domain-containing protein, partial [Thermostichales cyanobacterium SRBZ-1_bins_19]
MPEKGSRGQRRFWQVSRWGLGLGVGITGLLWGFDWAARTVVQEQLLPNVQGMLEAALGREVTLGPLQFVYPWQISLGPSEVAGLLQVERLGVGVNLWRWLTSGQAELAIHLDQPQLTLTETDQGWPGLLATQPPTRTGSLPIQGVTVQIRQGQLLPQPRQGSLAPLTGLEGTLKAELGDKLRLQGQVGGNWAGGRLLAQGSGQGQDWQLTLRGQGIVLEQAGTVPLGQGAGRVDLLLQLGTEDLRGWLKLDQVQVQGAGLPQPLTGITGEVQLVGSQVLTQDLRLSYGGIPLQVGGRVDWLLGSWQLRGVTERVPYGVVAATVGLPTAVPVQGQVQAEVELLGPWQAPVLLGSFVGQGQVDRLELEGVRGQFRVRQGEVSLRGLEARLGEGRIQGEGDGGSLSWRADNLDLAGLAATYGTVLPLDLGRLQGQGQVDLGTGQVQGTWNLQGGELTGTGALDWHQGRLSLSGSTQLPQGSVQAQVLWDPETIQANLDLAGIPVAGGVLAGQVQGTVPTGNLTLGAARLQAQGQLQLEQLRDPLQVRAVWDGKGITGQLNHPWGQVQGQVEVDAQRFSLGAVQANWQITQLPLQALPIPLDLSGTFNGAGTVAGSLERLRGEGRAELQDLRVAGVGFHPRLQGSLAWDQGLGQAVVDLRGGKDRLALRWQGSRPEQFLVQRGATLAEGRGDGERLQMTLTGVPLAWLQGIVPQLPPLDGDLEGQVDWDWGSQSAAGRVAVARVNWGGLQAESLQGQFRYRPEQLDLEDLSLSLLNSRYQLAGQVMLGQTPQFNLRLLSGQGSLEDWVQTFGWRDWQDLRERGLSLPALGPARELEVTPLSVLGLALLEQIQRYEQILAQLAELAQQQSQLPLPPLRSLRGSFQAQATLSGSLDDPRLTFAVRGQDWSLADRQSSFALDEVQASGSLSNGTLVLAPLQLRYDNRRASFRGSLAPDQQQGSLVIEGMPLEILQPFLPRLVRVRGDLDLNADVSGSLNHPQITGQASLRNGRLNQIPLESGTARFQYQNAQLNLDSTFFLNPQAPIRLNGQIPLALPFSQDIPNPDSLNLSLKLENDGLELVNLLTTAIRWEGEQEDLDLTIRGSLTNPTLLGSLRVRGGSLRLPQFAEPIQDIAGEIQFNADQIHVTGLTGTWQQGSLRAEGVLPINIAAQGQEELPEQPLTLTLENLRLDTPLYQGQARGALSVHGRLLNPLLGGEVILDQGVVDLGNLPQPQPGQSAEAGVFQPEWNGLILRLGSPADVRHPLFRFIARGEVALFGPLAQPQPSGVITLDRGQVNLFATSFRLDRSRPNTVTFDRNFDPLLDLRLTTQLTEFFRPTAAGLAFDANRNLLGSQQTIQVRADVKGRASDLAANDPRTNIIQLSSTPFRSRDEIIGLMGGNAIAGLAADNGLVGLAGSALFFTIQDTLIETFGLDDVRLGPVVQPTRDGSRGRFSVGLELEGAKDLGP